MRKVALFSLLIVLGLSLSQSIDLSSHQTSIQFISLIALSYIMIEMGLEFTIDKKRLSQYGKDHLVAMTAATFPWILCTIWFWIYFDITLAQATIIGRFAAPTSAGILFTLLAAAGLKSTWVFHKARVLAIFDDLDTLLLMILLQMIPIGFQWHALLPIPLIAALIWAAYRYQHCIILPSNQIFFLFYAIGITFLCKWLKDSLFIHLEILLPSFVFGCMLKKSNKNVSSEHPLDTGLKALYMLFVGCSLPRLSLSNMSWIFFTSHALAITFLANLGKLYPMLCYKKEASLREKAALSIAMWPRGEMGIGILLFSLNYGLPDVVVQIAGLSVALNLLLTGWFITLILRLVRT